jgi:hypothetical protein
MIVGGYALAFHGAPRYTGDIDIYVQPDPLNARQILTALETFGFGSVGIKQEDLETPNKVIQLGFPPVRIDIITSISGLSWDEAVKERIKGEYGDISVYYIGKTHYVMNKRASGRKKDLADLEALGEE